MKLNQTLAAALLAALPLAGRCENMIDLGVSGLSLESRTPSAPARVDTDGPQLFVAGRTDFGVLPVFFGYDVSYAATSGSASAGPVSVDADLDLLQVRTGLAIGGGNG